MIENSYVTYSIAVLDYIRNGRVSLRHQEFRDQIYDQTMLRLSTSAERDVICHDFHFDSAYADNDLPFSNFSYVHFYTVRLYTVALFEICTQSTNLL